MFNYAMSLDETRGFVLGYAVQQTEFADVGAAVFQPTSVSYSVSHVPPTNSGMPNPQSSVNFHMKVVGEDGVLNGNLPSPPLLGHSVGNDGVVDGLFSLRYKLFEEKFVNRVVIDVLKSAVEKLGIPDYAVEYLPEIKL